MTALWSMQRCPLPRILADHDVRITIFARLSGAAYASLEPASPRAVLIFGRHGAWHTRVGAGSDCTATAFGCAPTTRPVAVAGDSVDGCVEVSMPPWVAGRILPELFEAGGATALADLATSRPPVDTGDSLAHTAASIARWLAGRLADCPPARPEIVWSWQQIMAGSASQVRHLAAEIGWSERHFGQLFRSATGLEPKMAMQLARFHAALNLVLSSPEALSAIAGACGYADQSHMTRAFLRFAGAPPAAARVGAASALQIVASPA